MIRIYSRCCHDTLLHVVIHRDDLKGPRKNVSDPAEPMQVATIQIGQNQEFTPHIHKPRHSTICSTQEAWVVVEGQVRVSYYDIDKSLLCEEVLNRGDCSVTYRGGHGYKGLSDKALVYEFKGGPYMGSADLDKEFV